MVACSRGSDRRTLEFSCSDHDRGLAAPSVRCMAVGTVGRKEHWDTVYDEKSVAKLSCIRMIHGARSN